MELPVYRKPSRISCVRFINGEKKSGITLTDWALGFYHRQFRWFVGRPSCGLPSFTGREPLWGYPTVEALFDIRSVKVC